MLIDALLNMFDAFLGSFANLFPTGTVDLSGLHAMDGYMSWVGLFIDLGVWGGVLTTIIAGELAVQTVRVALFIWRLTGL